MRIKNKEIRARRHRKEQKVKDAARELRAQYGDAKAPQADKAAAPRKAAAPKKSSDGAAKPAAAKKAATPRAKKAQPKAE